jgi:hypothetical protein
MRERSDVELRARTVESYLTNLESIGGKYGFKLNCIKNPGHVWLVFLSGVDTRIQGVYSSVLQELWRATSDEFCTWNVLVYQITSKNLKPAFVNF